MHRTAGLPEPQLRAATAQISQQAVPCPALQQLCTVCCLLSTCNPLVEQWSRHLLPLPGLC
jgi:hypothetical protein